MADQRRLTNAEIEMAEDYNNFGAIRKEEVQALISDLRHYKQLAEKRGRALTRHPVKRWERSHQMPDEQLEKLGEYFAHFRILERYGITFERFIEKWRLGTWEAYLA